MSKLKVLGLGVVVSSLVGCTFEVKDDRPAQPLVIAFPASVNGATPTLGNGGIYTGGGDATSGLGGTAAADGGDYLPPSSNPQEPPELHFCPPRATSEIVLRANLDSRTQRPSPPWDPQNIEYTSDFVQNVQILDSLGVRHTLTLAFRNTGLNSWEYHALVLGDELFPLQAGLNVELGTGTLSFTNAGQLDTFTQGTPISVNFRGATPAQEINLEFGTPLSGGGKGVDAFTAFAASGSVWQRQADGCLATLAASCAQTCEPLAQVGSFGELTAFDVAHGACLFQETRNNPWRWCEPRATTSFHLTGNLDSQSAVLLWPWDPVNPARSSNFSTSFLAYDSLGSPHGLDLYFRKTDVRAWEYHVMLSSEEHPYPIPATPEIGSGRFTFDETGALATVTPVVAAGVTFSGAQPTLLTIDLGTPRAQGGTGLDGLTHFLGRSTVRSQGVDGCRPYGAFVCTPECGL